MSGEPTSRAGDMRCQCLTPETDDGSFPHLYVTQVALDAANEAFNTSAGRLRKLYAIEKLSGNLDAKQHAVGHHGAGVDPAEPNRLAQITT